MIVYHSSKKGFVDDVFNGTIADDIDHAFYVHLGRHTSQNEVMSWKNSMMHMYKVIDTPDIPDNSSIAIEYQIPLTSKRIDFIISGSDADGKSNIVIIELKQWEHAKISDKSDLIVTRFQHGETETIHPSYQAWSYAFMLENYNEAVESCHIALNPCAFLHNYADDGIISNARYSEYIGKAPLFLKTYTSKKTYDDLGNWSHEEIVLQPKNPEFSPIVIHEDEADEFRVIGEFVGCLPKVGMSRDPQ